MREDGSFCSQYCWRHLNVLYSGYIRKPSVFPLKLLMNHNSVADSTFVSWKEMFVNDILSASPLQTLKILTEPFYSLWQYSYLPWLNENLYPLLLGQNWKPVMQPRSPLERGIKTAAHLIRCDQMLVKNEGGLYEDEAHLESPLGKTSLVLGLAQPA